MATFTDKDSITLDDADILALFEICRVRKLSPNDALTQIIFAAAKLEQ